MGRPWPLWPLQFRRTCIVESSHTYTYSCVYGILPQLQILRKYWVNWKRHTTATVDFHFGRRLFSKNWVCGELTKVQGAEWKATLVDLHLQVLATLLRTTIAEGLFVAPLAYLLRELPQDSGMAVLRRWELLNQTPLWCALLTAKHQKAAAAVGRLRSLAIGMLGQNEWRDKCCAHSVVCLYCVCRCARSQFQIDTRLWACLQNCHLLVVQQFEAVHIQHLGDGRSLTYVCCVSQIQLVETVGVLPV